MGKGLNQDEIIKRFLGRGLTIDDPSIYINRFTKFNVEDKDGYRYFLSLTSLNNNLKKFARFDKSNPHTIHNIKNWLILTDDDYELLSEEYQGNEEKLTWRKISRPDLPPFNTSWHMFYSDGNRHPLLRVESCANSKRKSPQQIRKIIEKLLQEKYNGWSLNEGEEFKYRNPDTKLKLTHEIGYRTQSQLGCLERENQKRLVIFSARYPEESIHNVNLWMQLNSKFKLKEGQKYSYFRGRYTFICEDHGEFENVFCTIYSYNTGCPDCITLSKLGENNANWNPYLTEEDRERGRNIEGYSEWRKAVLARDNYSCQCCGLSESGLFNAHHMDSYDWAVDRRVDMDNGVTLCGYCHKEFHLEYGYGRNTRAQFEEYKNQLHEELAHYDAR